MRTIRKGPDDTWRCSKCSAHKARALFARKKDGNPHSWCKSCSNQASREARLRRTPEQYKADCDKLLNNRLRMKYGISMADYEKMLRGQGGGCAICGTNKNQAKSRRMHVDHCHSTGMVRGILCGSCNTGLGHFGDNTHKLNRAIKYLTEWGQ